MSPTRTLLLYGSLALFANVIPTQQALAVALRPNKTTDDSVCDLTHHTNLYLGSKTLVPSVAQTKDKVAQCTELKRPDGRIQTVSC
jgi:hypothetical protein